MPTMYYVRWSEAKIVEREVLRTTEQSVFVPNSGYDRAKRPERREAKSTAYEGWFDTWESAHAELLRRAEADVMSARRTLERRNSHFGNVKGLNKPTAAQGA